MSRRARRRRARNIRYTVSVGVLLIMIVVGFFALSAKPASAGDSSSQRFKYYTSITVQEGDTLWGIANEHMSKEYPTINKYINEVQKINHLNGTEIISGTTLVIPYYSDEYKL